MRTFNCLYCGKENKWSYSTANKYCSNECQGNHTRQQRIDKWVNEGKAWKTTIPQWAKEHLAEVKGYVCECCGISEWNGKKIVLEVDHIDGIHYNNSISNLRLICPNCHSQTDTYKNKNKGNGRSYRLPV